jgi:hypothetical protein
MAFVFPGSGSCCVLPSNMADKKIQHMIDRSLLPITWRRAWGRCWLFRFSGRIPLCHTCSEWGLLDNLPGTSQAHASGEREKVQAAVRQLEGTSKSVLGGILFGFVTHSHDDFRSSLSELLFLFATCERWATMHAMPQATCLKAR